MATIRRSPSEWKMILDASSDDVRRGIFANNARVKGLFGHLYGRTQIKVGAGITVRGTLDAPTVLGKAPYRRTNAERQTARPTHKHTMSNVVDAAWAYDDAINAGHIVEPTSPYAMPAVTEHADAIDQMIADYDHAKRPCWFPHATVRSIMFPIVMIPKRGKRIVYHAPVVSRPAAASIPSVVDAAVGITARLPRKTINWFNMTLDEILATRCD